MRIYSFVFLLPALFLDSYLPAVATPRTKDSPDHNPWEQVRTPTESGKNEAIGFYSAGCLARAEKLPMDSEGHHMMKPSRNRFWAHASLTQFLQTFSQDVRNATQDELLVGDTAQPRGGPFTTGHASHQIGLDMDVWFLQAKEARFQGNPSSRQRENTSARSLLNPRGKPYPEQLNPPGVPDLDPNFWSAKKVAMLRAAASHPDVERIFVHPYIKKALCQEFGNLPTQDALWLRKIRPWWSHHYHFHVRLRCPEGSPECRVQEAVPAGDGCGNDLGWWFTDAAREEWRRIQEAERTSVFKLPKLPDSCAALLK